MAGRRRDGRTVIGEGDIREDGTPGKGRAGRTADLRKRLVSSAVLVPGAILLIWIGGEIFEVGILAVAALMAWEWGGLVAALPDRGKVRAILLAALLASFAAATATEPRIGMYVALAAVPLALLVARQMRVVGAGWIVTAVIGTVFPALALIWMRSHVEFGLETVIYVIASVSMTDVGAYAAGRAIGGPKLLPSVSPSKTWAGLAGGIAGSMLVAGLFTVLHVDARMAALAPLAVLIATIAQAGDLMESAVKRHFKVKDSGTMIPGHGGILDRVDGQMTVLPVIALAMAVTERSVLQW